MTAVNDREYRDRWYVDWSLLGNKMNVLWVSTTASPTAAAPTTTLATPGVMDAITQCTSCTRPAEMARAITTLTLGMPK